MNKYLRGIIAGLIATIFLSLLMLLKAEMGLMPQFDVIGDLSQFFAVENRIVGWIIHFIMGSVIWALIFVFIVTFLKGPYWIRGLFFGVLAWLLMMLVYMPVMGHGLFAVNLGTQVMIATLVLHLIYGIVLGLVYGWFPRKIPIERY